MYIVGRDVYLNSKKCQHTKDLQEEISAIKLNSWVIFDSFQDLRLFFLIVMHYLDCFWFSWKFDTANHGITRSNGVPYVY